MLEVPQGLQQDSELSKNEHSQSLAFEFVRLDYTPVQMHTQTAASAEEEEQVVQESEGQCFDPWPQQSTQGGVLGQDTKPQLVLMCLRCVSVFLSMCLCV